MRERYGRLPKKNPAMHAMNKARHRARRGCGIVWLTAGAREQDRKYFDSGDYALNKAGKASDKPAVGKGIPTPDVIPHPSAKSSKLPS